MLLVPIHMTSPNALPGVSTAFQTFLTAAPDHATAWMAGVRGLESASKLDKKTSALAYLAVLAAVRLESGIPFHTRLAKQAGATREEIISAVLIGLPAVGNAATQALPAALTAYDES
jgi:alkylhydroperoxidase/carboxymuconolactone decarboxylase family protein YurZ